VAPNKTTGACDGMSFFIIFFFSPGFDRHNGISLFIWSDVPLGKGVSSSASVEIACMKAAAEVWSVL
jgi:galactokinase